MPKINELFEQVTKDKELQAKYVDIIQDGLKLGEVATYEKLIDFAKDVGYDITIDDIKEYLKEMTASIGGELPDSDLDKVAGGFAFPGGGPGYLIGGPIPIGPGLPMLGEPGRVMMSVVIAGTIQCNTL